MNTRAKLLADLEWFRTQYEKWHAGSMNLNYNAHSRFIMQKTAEGYRSNMERCKRKLEETAS